MKSFVFLESFDMKSLAERFQPFSNYTILAILQKLQQHSMWYRVKGLLSNTLEDIQTQRYEFNRHQLILS